MPSRIILKPALTIEQQLDLLKSRGLIIDQIEKAREFLIDNNYYRLNVYFHKFMDAKDHFCPGTDFSTILKIYQNDIFLRQQIFSVLEPIEISIKTKVAYYLGNKYGSDVFYKEEIYKNIFGFEKVSDMFLKEKIRNADDPVIRHHENRYSGFFPIWVIVEYLTFNGISIYFSNLKTTDRECIGINGFGINEYYFKVWIHSLSVLRNICAHFGFLYKREYAIPISFGNESSKYPGQGNTLFGLFYCIKKLSKKDRWSDFYTEICQKIGEEVLISDYNFPPDLSELMK